MTRINLIDPSELYDQHLIAEYREIRLLTANTRRSFMLTGKSKDKIPKQFTLNVGHVTFFKDKGEYISKRYQLLQQEMRKRGFEPKFPTIDVDVWPEGFFNDWTPSERDKDLVRARITERFGQRPQWYRYYGKLMTGPII